MTPSLPEVDSPDTAPVAPLSERADELRALLRRRSNLTKASTKGEHLHQLAALLESAADSVEPCAQAFGTLRANDVEVEGPREPAKVTEARTLVRDLLDASEDVDLVTNRSNQDLATQVAKRVGTYAEHQAKRNESAWSAYLAPPRVPERNDELLEVIATVEDLGEQTRAIKGLFRQLDTLRTQPPTDQASWDRAAALVQQLREGIEGLDSSDMPPPVLSFIKAAAAGGAPLSTYTQEVADWLSGPQKAKFRVVWDGRSTSAP